MEFFLLKNNGFLFIATLPMLLVLLGTALGILTLTYLGQNQIALQYRLEICTMRILREHHILLQRLMRLNKTMPPLQKVVYIARGVQYINPLSGVLTQKAALLALKAIEKIQDTLLALGSLKIIPLRYCESTPYSKEIALCFWKFFQRNKFQRAATLYSDVPGTLAPKSDFIKHQISCKTLKSSRSLSYSLAPRLMNQRMNYEYP